MKRVSAAWLAVLLALLLPTAAAATTADGRSLYNLTGVWTGGDGRPASVEDTLMARPAVVAMIYTGCTSLCPLIVERMKAIEDALTPDVRAKVRFVLFSIDADHDTPDSLSAFAAARGIDTARWGLYRGDARTVRQLAMALGISYRQEPDGSFDHSNVLILIDGRGVVRDRTAGVGAPPPSLVQALTGLTRE